MSGLMPYYTTSTELQRNFKKVLKKVKRVKEPVTVLSNNKPALVIVDYELFEKSVKKGRSFFGMFSGANITDSDIDKVIDTWDKQTVL